MPKSNPTIAAALAETRERYAQLCVEMQQLRERDERLRAELDAARRGLALLERMTAADAEHHEGETDAV